VLLLGHRGAVTPSCPENTLASVDRALRGGADGVEIDVRLTADGVPVCLHDPGLGRLTGTRTELAEVLRADLPSVGGHPIPTLEEVLDLVGDRGRLVVELKKPTTGVVGTVEAVAAVLGRHRLGDVVVSSFDRRSVRALRMVLDAQALPAVRTALLGRPGLPLGALLQRALVDGHDEVHPHVLSLLTRLDLVRRATQQGITVTGWTVNRSSDLARMAAAEVDAVICDDPRAAQMSLHRPALVEAG
jgi:glycerophosphoryl diester phosphodiesterase